MSLAILGCFKGLGGRFGHVMAMQLRFTGLDTGAVVDA